MANQDRLQNQNQDQETFRQTKNNQIEKTRRKNGQRHKKVFRNASSEADIVSAPMTPITHVRMFCNSKSHHFFVFLIVSLRFASVSIKFIKDNRLIMFKAIKEAFVLLRAAANEGKPDIFQKVANANQQRVGAFRTIQLMNSTKVHSFSHSVCKMVSDLIQKITTDVDPAKQAAEIRKLIPTDIPRADAATMGSGSSSGAQSMADQLDAMMNEFKNLDNKVSAVCCPF